MNATITDDLRLNTVIITEDSSGSWKNYTITNPVSNVYSFSLHSANLSQSQTVNYRWYANDSSNNLAASSLQTFVVQSTSTEDAPSGGGGSGSGGNTGGGTGISVQPGDDSGDVGIGNTDQSQDTSTGLEQPTAQIDWDAIRREEERIELEVIGIQTQDITPEITTILGGFVQTITSEVNQEITTVKRTEDGINLYNQETKLDININPITKTVENLKLDLGIIKEIKQEQAIEFEENYS